jgi:heme/copper-type cytochrome/quinol oxidase subunit 2
MRPVLPKPAERFRAAAILAALMASGALSSSQSAHADQPAGSLPDAMSKASKEAFELLSNAKTFTTDVTIQIVGDQGRWTSTYLVPPGPTITSPPGDPPAKMAEAGEDLVVPKGKSIALIFTSHDQIYELAIPDLDRSATAMPGRLETVDLIAIPPGRFGLVCTAGCNAGDIATPFAIRVVSPEDYEQWLRRKMDQKP